MSWTDLDDPQRWRKRAEDAGSVAEQMSDPATVEMMFNVVTRAGWCRSFVGMDIAIYRTGANDSDGAGDRNAEFEYGGAG